MIHDKVFLLRRILEERGIEAGAAFIDPTTKDPLSTLKLMLHAWLAKRQFHNAAIVLWGPNKFTPEPLLVRETWQVLDEANKIIVIGGAGLGKSLSAKTKVLMFDGSFKEAQHVKPGDVLMGDDSKPRTVLQCSKGRSIMYEVSGRMTEPWVCNKHHILSLKCAHNKWNNGQKTTSSTYTKGNTIDIPIEDYIKKSKTFKKHYRAYRVPVEFTKQPIPVDPYLYGAWIADGTKIRLEITKPKCNMTRYWCRKLKELGLQVEPKESKKPCIRWAVSGTKNPVMRFFKSSIRNDEKRIDRRYLINDRKSRLSLLAGLLDGDGHVNGSCFEITTKYEGLKDDICFLARSLGFVVSATLKKCSIKSSGFKGHYWRMYIKGPCHEIPTLDKKAIKRKATIDHLCDVVNIKELPEDDYYSITIDGNQRFLLSDFTVTHNSYNGAVWYLLDWIMDADNTFIQCLSVTKQHAKTNIFAHIKDLHQSSIIPLPGERKGESIQAPSGSDHAGILLKALPQGDNGYGKLRGFHPYPRKIPHPVYGKLTRIRLLLDEAEEIPIGIWEGVQNMLSTQDPDDYKGQIKIFAATNPKDKLSELGKRVEPATGWQSIDPDKHHRWISGTNWTIQRLDALRSENYIQKKQVFPGFQSYMGVQEYASLGTNTVDWWAMVRGFFPPQGIFGVVVPPYLIEQNMGQWVFTKNVMNAGGLDVAFANHGDGLVFSHFRFGEANAYIDQSGQLVPLVRPQLAIQFDDIFPLQKLKTKALAEYIKELCETFKIQPQWFALDCTGNATGLYHTLTDIWSDEVIGVDYSSKATDLKVLREDKKAANEQYDGIVTELFFAVQRLSEAGVIKYNPNCSDTNYIKELTSRKFKQKAAGFVRVQSKHDYMADGRDSPDYADSFTLGIHAVRRASENFVPSLVGPEDKPPAPPPPAPDWTDTIEYETFD